MVLVTIGMGSVWSLVACQSGLGSTCSSDSDCRSDRVCADKRCSKTCSGDKDCSRPGYECRPYSDPNEDETLDICQSARDAGGDGSSRCRTDQQCRNRLDAARAQCGINRRCILPTASPRYGLRIRDRTAIDGDAQDDGPGADLAAAVVTATDRSPMQAYAFGDTLAYRPAGDVGAGGSPLDGSPPEWNDTETCIRGSRADETVSLGGEGGELIVQFRDDTGAFAELRNDSRVVVVEWGSNCGTPDAPTDTYRVDLCVSYDGAIEPSRDCRRRLGTGSGLERFDLPDDLGS
jgi:hypothetical protein